MCIYVETKQQISKSEKSKEVGSKLLVNKKIIKKKNNSPNAETE